MREISAPGLMSENEKRGALVPRQFSILQIKAKNVTCSSTRKGSDACARSCRRHPGRDGGALVMETFFGALPFVLKLYTDGGYRETEFRDTVKKVLAQVNVEIVKRPDQAKSFIVLPKRWIVEPTFAWLG